MPLAISKRVGVYAGSFDPPTNGHLWMIREGAKLFDRLIVAVGVNPEKKALFSAEERMKMIASVVRGLGQVEIASFENEYLVHYAERVGATHILRGIRNPVDFHYELPMRQVNGDLNPAITSVFLMPPRELGEISSSMVKGLVGPKGWQEVVQKMVPPVVFDALKEGGVK